MGDILFIGGVLMGALVCNGTDTGPEFVTFGVRPTLEFNPTELCKTGDTLVADVFEVRPDTGTDTAAAPD